MSSTPIKFNFHPYKIESKEHVVEKSENGMKRRYLRGVSSGLKLDGHNERMTENAIKSFSNQAGSGDVLLYPDVHGIRYTDDIGRLSHHEILPDGDWLTEYRLYDQADDIDDVSLQRANKLWKQVNGLPPYTAPKQKGFSVEGSIPEGGLLSYKEDGAGNVMDRVIDSVLLDGVIVVPRPAYEDSVAHAVYKALGLQPPWVTKKVVEESFQKDLTEFDSYYYGRYHIEDALYKAIDKIMCDDNPEKFQRLDTVFNIYKSKMVNLIQSNENDFVLDMAVKDKGLAMSKDQLFKDLQSTLDRISRSLTVQ